MSRPKVSMASIFVSVAMSALLACGAAHAQSRDSGGTQPRPRLLLVFAPNEDNKPLAAQYQALERDAGEVNAEDVDVLYVVGDREVKLPPPDSKKVSSDSLRKRYHVDATGFRVVLVGSDGWEKARWSEPTDPHKILSHAADMPKPKSALDSSK